MQNFITMKQNQIKVDLIFSNRETDILSGCHVREDLTANLRNFVIFFEFQISRLLPYSVNICDEDSSYA